MAKITRGFDLFGNRYKYDKLFGPDKGWAQLDTKQDASYYGGWINPVTLELFSYTEGDVTHTRCDDDADFTTTLRECIEWHREREYFIGIDCWQRPQIIEALTRLGFAQELH